MANKTAETGQDIGDFIAGVLPAARQHEARALDALFRAATGFQPRLWGPSIIGYGRYHYRYASGHEGWSPATGFSPRKAALTVYILPGFADFAPLLADLGKHRLGKSCLYIPKLADIDQGVLMRLVRVGLADLARRWPIEPS